MTEKYRLLMSLSGTEEESLWLKTRLEELSPKESIIFDALLERSPPECMRDVLGCIVSIDYCDIFYPARNFSELGPMLLEEERGHLPRAARDYVDWDSIGRRLAQKYEGAFSKNAYVCFRDALRKPEFCEDNVSCEDKEYSVKIKVSSPKKPEGVWIRLPDLEIETGRADEVRIALDELGVSGFDPCTLLEARCILPEAGDLFWQYDNIRELVRDGNNLGYLLLEENSGMPYFKMAFQAAMEFDRCQSLKEILETGESLSRFEFFLTEYLAEYAKKDLRKQGVSEELIESAIDLEGYGHHLMGERNAMLSNDESLYIALKEGDRSWKKRSR